MKMETLQKRLNKLCLGLEDIHKDESKDEVLNSPQHILGKRKRNLEDNLASMLEEQSKLESDLERLR